VAICYYSLISVAAYGALAVLFAVFAMKLYVYVMVTFLKKETPNPIAQCSRESSLSHLLPLLSSLR
jgi:hypothetical protein